MSQLQLKRSCCSKHRIFNLFLAHIAFPFRIWVLLLVHFLSNATAELTLQLDQLFAWSGSQYTDSKSLGQEKKKWESGRTIK